MVFFLLLGSGGQSCITSRYNRAHPKGGTAMNRRLLVTSSRAAIAMLVATAGLGTCLALGPRILAQSRSSPTTVNWPLHNLDLSGTRYSPMDQINRTNVKNLKIVWTLSAENEKAPAATPPAGGRAGGGARAGA